MDTKVLTAHVPLSLAKKVDELATRLERSRGWIVKQALSAWIEQEEERHRLTLEALWTSMPVTSSTTRPCRPGPTASRPGNLSPRRAGERRVDEQGRRRPDQESATSPAVQAGEG